MASIGMDIGLVSHGMRECMSSCRFDNSWAIATAFYKVIFTTLNCQLLAPRRLRIERELIKHTYLKNITGAVTAVVLMLIARMVICSMAAEGQPLLYRYVAAAGSKYGSL